MKLLVLAVFFVTCPALVLYLCRRYSAVDKLGSALICYGLGMLIANIGLVPNGAGSVQSNMMNVTIPLALPLLLFSLDLKRWSRLAGKTFLSFFIVMVAVLTATLVAFLIFRDTVEEAWKVAGMLIGVYTGGSVNLNAIGLGLKAKEHIIVLTNTADMLMCTPYFLLMLTYGQRLLNKFLPPFCPPDTTGKIATPAESCDTEILDFNDYRGIFSREVLLPLLAAVGLSVLIFALSFGVYSIVPESFNMAALMLTITTLGIGASLIPRIRNIKMTFHLGQYIILIFCLVVGSLADLKAVLSAAPNIIIFTGIVVYGCLFIHVLLGMIFRIDTDTVIITSIAAVFSPPFVPVVATALKNREVIISGITTGILGWVIGNYLGIGVAYFLKGLFSM